MLRDLLFGTLALIYSTLDGAYSDKVALTVVWPLLSGETGLADPHASIIQVLLGVAGYRYDHMWRFPTSPWYNPSRLEGKLCFVPNEAL